MVLNNQFMNPPTFSQYENNVNSTEHKDTYFSQGF